VVDDWEMYLDVMVDSVFVNSGRSCISCSGVWASRHTEAIAEAIAERLGPVKPLPPEDPKSSLAAFTVPGVADAISNEIDHHLKEEGVTEATAKHRGPGDSRLVARALRLPAATVVLRLPRGGSRTGTCFLRFRRALPAGGDDQRRQIDARGTAVTRMRDQRRILDRSTSTG
jgi:hypothetical protein